MIRKQIYIDPAQDVLLKQRARALGVSEAELIRRCLTDIGRSAVDIPVDWRAWEDELAFIQERAQSQPAREGRRGWTREELYEERVTRLLS
jgi:CO/xanthine dehydrogenase Mo-binding subunit